MVPTLARLIHHTDEVVLKKSCEALYLLLAGDGKGGGGGDEYKRVEIFIEAGVCGRLVELLQHSSVKVQARALDSVSNMISTGSDVQAQVRGARDGWV